MFTITGTRFGHFFEDILIYLLVFIDWPEQEIEVSVNSKSSFLNPNFLSYFNWNRQFRFKELPLRNRNWLGIKTYDERQYNYKALGSFILYSPATYFLLLFFDSGVRFLFDSLMPNPYNKYSWYFVTLLWLWGGIFFFGFVTIKNKATRRT
jgi:hypothetical protein